MRELGLFCNAYTKYCATQNYAEIEMDPGSLSNTRRKGFIKLYPGKKARVGIVAKQRL